MTLFVNKNKTGSWSVYQDEYADGGRTRSCVKKSDLFILGFDLKWTTNEARAWAKKLNQESRLEKKKVLQAKKNCDEKNLNQQLRLPEHLVAEFEKYLHEITIPNRRKKVMHHWSTVKRIIGETNLDVKSFKQYRTKIFLHLEGRQFSVDYSKKLLRILNLWGGFVCEISGLSFTPIHFSQYEYSRLFLAQSAKKGVRREAFGLTPEALNQSRNTFESNEKLFEWNWLFVALWLGLRPSEVDHLLAIPKLPIEKDDSGEIENLTVFQNKLRLSRKDLQIKRIPIYLPEQKIAARFLLDKKLKRPNLKFMKKIFGCGYDRYSPRKGFTDLMLSKGFQIEDIALMLGHSGIETLFKHYKNRRIVRLPKDTVIRDELFVLP